MRCCALVLHTLYENQEWATIHIYLCLIFLYVILREIYFYKMFRYHISVYVLTHCCLSFI
uniref:Uncharacterized protein n=1 Tax=Anguilla anguilla TaxID=7936 RepID=A0A0E9XTS3_ANGAN